MPYGLLTAADAAELERCLRLAAAAFPAGPLRVCEIGVRDGRTARGIRDHVAGLGRGLEYHGVDLGGDGFAQPFAEARMVWGDSGVVSHHVPDGLHLLLVDGCHCVRHVLLDFGLYGAKLRSGGLALFHDTHPALPPFQDYQEGPRDRPESHIAVRQGLGLLRLLPCRRGDWQLLADAADDRERWGGFCTYRKMY